VRLFFINEYDDREELANGIIKLNIGTLSVREVKERRHIVSKQVEMTTVDTNKKCGIVYFDVRYRDHTDVRSPISHRNNIYELLNRSIEVGGPSR
jgi:hypothetical protein